MDILLVYDTFHKGLKLRWEKLYINVLFGEKSVTQITLFFTEVNSCATNHYFTRNCEIINSFSL